MISGVTKKINVRKSQTTDFTGKIYFRLGNSKFKQKNVRMGCLQLPADGNAGGDGAACKVGPNVWE